MKLSEVESIPFALLDWNDLDRLTRTLAVLVLGSGIKYDRIIPLANGGLTMVRLFADLINLKTISPMQVASYQGVNISHTKPQIVQPLTVSVEGQSLLIFEDIVDTGATLVFALAELRKLGAAEIHTASLFRKTHASVHPEYSAELLDRWVIFPYEVRETIVDLSARWQKTAEMSEVKSRLATIGFSSSDIDQYA